MEVSEIPLSDAVITAFCAAEMTPARAVKVAVADPAGTVTDAGTLRAAELLDNATTSPPLPAALDSVTVHEVEFPAVRLVGAQASALNDACAASKSDADWELPL